MTMLYILAMTAVVFLSRYLFLEPRLPLRLNARAQHLLSFSSPAVLTAIWGPIVFLPEGKLDVSPENPYLLPDCMENKERAADHGREYGAVSGA
jgi:branched-subunit amino acid transport protein